MSARGTVDILSEDWVKLLESEYIPASYSYDLVVDDDVDCRVVLNYIDRFPVNDVIEQAPEVSWIAFADKYCESDNEVFIYVSLRTSAQLDIPSGLHTMSHIDEEPVLVPENLTEDMRVYSVYTRLMDHITKKED